MPSSEMIHTWLTTKLAELLFTEPDDIDIHEPFANYGLGSADAVGLSGELGEWLGRELSPTLVFDYPTIAILTAYLAQADEINAPTEEITPTFRVTERAGKGKEGQPQYEPIAIIGIGCRFPGGANTPERFWELLKSGFDGISEVPAERWNIDAFYSPDPEAPGKMYTRSGGFVADLDRFDASFFGISPREAVRMHPQQRLLLEVAWEALENAGQAESKSSSSRNTGIFMGFMQMQDYVQLQMQSGDTTYIDDPYYSIGSSASITSGRLSYLFDFQGPNLSIDTACSSSLVATHLACQSLRNKECNLALAGGINTNLLPENVVNACKMGMLSPEGHCKTFDASADGFVIGEGCGVIVLKRLSDALTDQDTILAVIRGSAVNQDGRSNGITAPNRLAQEAVIREALTNAGIDPRRVSYVEAHGSATPLGDPIEVEALANTLCQAHTTDDPLLIGSVKTNIGHLAGAAGIAGLIKTVLALQHKEIPPHLHLKERNPHVRWGAYPIAIPTTCVAWPTEEDSSRIAGVSSFGWSGTNAHILLEEAPTAPAAQPSNRKASLLVLSAKTETALEGATKEMLSYLREHPMLDLADVAYSGHVGRAAFAYRRMLVSETIQDAISQLTLLEPDRVLTNKAKEEQRAITFLFPDSNEQNMERMGHLYQQEPVFREWVDRCCEYLESLLGLDLRTTQAGILTSVLTRARSGAEYTQMLPPIQHASSGSDQATQTRAFVLDYALGRLLISWGIRPAAMLGYGSGEYVAACLAGVLSLKDALLLVTRQAQVGVEQPVERHMPFTLQQPKIPFISTITGTWITPEQATDQAYWMQQRDRPFISDRSVALLLQETGRIFLEVGMGEKMSFFIKQYARSNGIQQPLLLTCCPESSISARGSSALLTLVGKLWIAGIPIDWQGFYAHEQRTHVSLPTYPFERQRYWIEPQKKQLAPQATLNQLRREQVRNWYYFPGWKTAAPPFAGQQAKQKTTGWIFLLDDCGIGTLLIQQLRHLNANVITVTIGQVFNRDNERTYTINPTSPAHYEALFKQLRTEGYSEIRIVHLWTLTDPQQHTDCSNLVDLEEATRKGFYSVLTLIQSLEHLQFDACHITLLSNGIYDVLGDEMIYPEKATILGPCLAIPFEYPDVTCRCIDIAFPIMGTRQREELLSSLLNEIVAESTDSLVALRGNRRWLPAIDHLHLAEQPTQALREKGVYLITGGTGGIGLAMAEYLARTVHARLVLVGRSPLPPREDWTRLCAISTEKNTPGRQLHAINRMEALGAQVLYLQADVTNPAQMQEVVRQTMAAFGTINGVLHAAGIPGIGLLQLKTPEQAAKVLAPKVQGTLVLEQVLAPLAPDFLALFSSITTSVGGGPGQVDYTAANAFLDAYAQRNRYKHGRTIAIDWGEWQWNAWEEGLDGYDTEIQKFFREHRQRFGIPFAEGTEVFARLLTSQQPRVIVSTQEYQQFADSLKSFSVTGPGARTQQENQERQKYPRPALASSYTPPRSTLEQSIANLWEELLGITPVGIHDNFFELGGNSLVGINLVARMRKALQLEIFPAHVLYQAPSVSDMAHYIERGEKVVVIKERQERGEKRRAGLTQRLETMRRRK